MFSYIVGNVVCWKSITATSVNENIALKFARSRKPSVLFEILSIDGRNISILSRYAKEEEILFLPFSYFIVCNVAKDDTHGDVIRISMKQIQVIFCFYVLFLFFFQIYTTLVFLIVLCFVTCVCLYSQHPQTLK